MKRGFIRALWGVHQRDHRITRRRFRVDKNVKFIVNSKFNAPFLTYIMGEENLVNMRSLGFNCKMIDKNPAPFDLIKHQYRNKLEIIKYAMEEDGYDEIVYMDWDCFPQKSLVRNFWEELGKKESFQANLQMYWELYEPMFCNLHRSSPYSEEELNSKDLCFIHYQGGK